MIQSKISEFYYKLRKVAGIYTPTHYYIYEDKLKFPLFESICAFSLSISHCNVLVIFVILY